MVSQLDFDKLKAERDRANGVTGFAFVLGALVAVVFSAIVGLCII